MIQYMMRKELQLVFIVHNRFMILSKHILFLCRLLYSTTACLFILPGNVVGKAENKAAMTKGNESQVEIFLRAHSCQIHFSARSDIR